ncbi:MAG: hypothetical protein JSW59_12815 [Phycisphaerales bacterium]|nr:MAG: hypothetical protein JSW59_12815 [Phycisphaerales bacterium]
MKRVLITAWALAMASIGLTTVAQPVQTAKEPFIHVTPSKHSLDLGAAVAPGYYSVDKALTLKIDSNCLHGPIMISSTELKRSRGGSIPPKRIFVRSAATWGFVPMDRPVAVSRPQVGSHNIVLDLQVETGFYDVAGKYQGTFTVTVMPPV